MPTGHLRPLTCYHVVPSVWYQPGRCDGLRSVRRGIHPSDHSCVSCVPCYVPLSATPPSSRSQPRPPSPACHRCITRCRWMGARCGRGEHCKRLDLLSKGVPQHRPMPSIACLPPSSRHALRLLPAPTTTASLAATVGTSVVWVAAVQHTSVTSVLPSWRVAPEECMHSAHVGIEAHAAFRTA